MFDRTPVVTRVDASYATSTGPMRENNEDAIAIASLYRSLTRYLCNNPWRNWDMSAVTRAIVVENKWRAQRYGVQPKPLARM